MERRCLGKVTVIAAVASIFFARRARLVDMSDPIFVDVMVVPNPSSGEEELLLRFKSEEPARAVNEVFLDGQWCAVSGVDEGGVEVAAQALLVEDSGSGTALLVCGARWGVRISPPDASPHGETHLLLDPTTPMR
jgi:hypothetical protein